jgi:transglutaminase-like putative cysteine protease
MQIRFGYEFKYDFEQSTALILALNVHYSRSSDLVVPDHVIVSPRVDVRGYRDAFGNWRNRLLVPAGATRLSGNGVVNDSGHPDPSHPTAVQHPVDHLPEETLVFLLGSRYCETDRLMEVAWEKFANSGTGWGLVQNICDFVHRHIRFGYEYANPTKTAWDVFHQGTGVCRDYAHLAVAFCRCLNVPARYCTGYLSDIGIPPPHEAMDFAAWFEAYLDGRWWTFDPRNNAPRRGRILIARGRDAADVPMTTTFGPGQLAEFRVWTDEVTPGFATVLGIR